MNNSSQKSFFSGKADIVFLLETSNQVGQQNFKEELVLFDSVAQAFPVKKDGVNFAGIVYSTTPQVSFQLNTYTEKPALSIAIRDISYTGGKSNVGKAIASVETSILQKSGRPGIPKVVVVLMVEKSEDDMMVPATALKAQGTKLIMVAVGGDVDASLLGSVASSPDSVLLVDKMDELSAQAAALVVKINNGLYCTGFFLAAILFA